MTTLPKRITVVAAAAAAVLLATVAPAFAHVQVSADKPQAGATDVTVQFSAESESDTAGAKTVQVVLPDGATSLAFKSVVTYGNNQADRWIEIPQAGQPEPPHPAPVLALQPAAAQPSSAAPSSAAPTTAAPSSAAPAATKTAGGTSATPWIIAGVVVLIVLAGAGIWLARRRTRVT